MIFSSNHTYTPMPSRLTGYFYAKKWAYRYSFNGQERDDEIAGAGNIMTAEFWEYDTRLGRRWNLDPIEYPWQSGYSTFNNNPNYFNDPFGLEGEKPGEQRTTSEGCNEVFNGKSWQDDQSSLKEILVTAARPQSKILKFLGEMDDAIHNPQSKVSRMGQTIGQLITDHNPITAISNFVKYFKDGKDIYEEEQSLAMATVGLAVWGSGRRIINLVNWNKHHIIPNEIYKVFKNYMPINYVQNAADNLKKLPFPWHSNHPAYNAFVSSEFSKEIARNGKLSIEFIEKFQLKMRIMIRDAYMDSKVIGKKEWNNTMNDFFK